MRYTLALLAATALLAVIAYQCGVITQQDSILQGQDRTISVLLDALNERDEVILYQRKIVSLSEASCAGWSRF
jgi:hypothetical protein